MYSVKKGVVREKSRGERRVEGDDEEAEDEDSVSFSSQLSCVVDGCCGVGDVGDRECAQVQMACEEVTVGASVEADCNVDVVDDDVSQFSSSQIVYVSGPWKNE